MNPALITIILFISNQLTEFIILFILDGGYNDLCRFDCGWYSTIVSYGYDLEPHAHARMDAANWAFFPFHPVVATIISHLTNISPGASLVITSKLFFFFAIFYFMKMVKEYSPSISYTWSGFAAAFNPYAIYGNVGYTESAFLLFTSLFFYHLKKERIALSSITATALTSIRLVGLFSILPYLIFSIQQYKKDKNNLSKLVFYTSLIPLGLGLFSLYLYCHVGDALAFSHIQRAWGREISNPLTYITNGLMGEPFYKYASALSIGAILASLFFAYKKYYYFSIFTFFCTIIPISTGLWSMPRYISWQAPLLFLFAHLLQYNRTRIFLIPIMLISQPLMYYAWLTDKGWII